MSTRDSLAWPESHSAWQEGWRFVEELKIVTVICDSAHSVAKIMGEEGGSRGKGRWVHFPSSPLGSPLGSPSGSGVEKKTLHSSVTLGQPQLTNSKEVNGNRDSDYYKTDGSCRWHTQGGVLRRKCFLSKEATSWKQAWRPHVRQPRWVVLVSRVRVTASALYEG